MRRALFLILFLFSAGLASAQTAAFTASRTTGCPPMVVVFTDQSTGSPTGWAWDFGDGNTSTQQHPTTYYLTPGNYTVKLTVTYASGSSVSTTKTSYITVLMPPTVSLTASPLTACKGVPISYTSSVTWNATGTGTYNWDFGDGGGATTSTATHAYTTAGTYTVKLTATNGAGCPATDTESNYITIHPGPAVAFTASPTTICALGGGTTFTSTTTGTGTLSYNWDFGDATSSTSSGPISKTYGGAGTYTVRLSVTDGNGCTDSLKRNNYITVNVVNAVATVPSSACAGTNVNVSSGTGTTPSATLSWDFGDGSATVSGGSASHVYTTAGTYTVSLYATVGGCTDTSSSTIVINAKPSVAFTYSPLNPCPSPSTVTFTNNTTGATSYVWDFDDGFTSTAGSPSHTYTRDTIFNVKLTAVSSAGCGASVTQQLNIIPAKMEIVPDQYSYEIAGCYPFTHEFVDTNYISPPPFPSPLYTPVYPFATTSRSWNFGDPGSSSNTSSGYHPSHTYALPGTYYASVVTTTANGCTFVDSIEVHVGDTSIVNFFPLPNDTVCAGSPIQFFDSSIGIAGPIRAWFWSFGDQNHSFVMNPTHIYKKPGVYTVTLRVDQNGCVDSLTKVNYIKVNDPASIPYFRVSCDTLGFVQFSDSSIGATSRLWYFGDGTTSTATHPAHQYAAAAGMYKGSLVCWNSTTGCKDSTEFTVVINNFNIGIAADDSTVCPGDTVTLTPNVTGAATSLGGVVREVKWYYSTNPTGPWSQINPAYMTSALGNLFTIGGPGRYSIKVEFKDINDCMFTKIAPNFIIVGGPKAYFKATPPHGCAPATIVFTDTSHYVPGTTIGSLKWEFGDGTSATTTSPTTVHGYTLQGSYGISLVVTDNIGCKDSLGIPNYLGVTRPTSLFTTIGNNACEGTAFMFYSSSTGSNITHAWSFGDGGTSTASSPSHIYNTGGTYTVRLIVTDQFGCKDTSYSVAPIVVHARPVASFTMDDTLNICPPLIVNFSNTSTGAVSYLWSFGNTAGSSITNPTATYSNAGIFTIRLIATNSVGCKDTAYDRVRVLGYSGVMSYAPLKGCAPFTVHFKANNVPGVPGFIYNWGDGTTSATTATSISHTYLQPGPHVPSITLTDNLGCSATSMGIDTIKVDGVYAGFTLNPFPACDRGTIQFIDTSKGAYSALSASKWKFHDGTTSTLPSPSKTYPGPGKYPVTLYTSTVSGCLDTFESQVIFHPLPHIEAGKDTLICKSDSIMLKPKGGVSYTWSPANALSCSNCNNPLAFPSIPTRFVVIGKDSNGCTNKDSLMITLKYKTETKVEYDNEICSGDTIRLVAEGASVYHWSPAEGLSDAFAADPLAFPMTDKHYVLVSRLAGCIPDTDYVDIVVRPTPTVDASPGQTIIAGSLVRLESSSTGIIKTYRWDPSDGLLSPAAPNSDAYPKRTTLYSITVKTEYGCTATDTVRIIVVCDNSQVFMPNTFTPNGNGVNDVFYPRGKGLANIEHFRIYNRWGNLVFERANIAVDDKRAGWDGKMNGQVLSPDIYVYTIEATCDTGEPIKWQGDVMLLR